MNDKIKTALVVMELHDKSSIRQIRTQYKKLIHRWHPDKCKSCVEECHEKTIQIIESYKLLMDYCENYIIAFNDPVMETEEEFWARRFGDDPMWGKNK